MDNDTFETLCEVLAFECSADHSKYKAFTDIFYGSYKNRPPTGLSVLNVDASKLVTLIQDQRVVPFYITGYEWSMDDRSYMGGHAGSRTKVRLELVSTEGF